MFSKQGLVSALIIVLMSATSFAQHLYYKTLTGEHLVQFSDTSGKIMFDRGDTLSLGRCIAYATRFFPNFEFNSIKVIYKEMDHPALVKPGFKNLFKSSEKRDYTLYISSACPGTLDSVTFKNLNINARAGLVARQMSHIYDYSTSGFFDLLGWYFRQLSGKAKRKASRESEEKALEYGIGYQVLSLSLLENEKLIIDNWRDAEAYEKYIRYEKDRHMNPASIRILMNDLPVYVSKPYK